MNETTFWELVEKAADLKTAKAKLEEAKAKTRAAEEELELARTREEYARYKYQDAHKGFAAMLERVYGRGTER